MERFLSLIDEIIEEDVELAPETEYRKLESWDSLMAISFLAMVNVEYGKTLRMADVKNTETLADLYEVVQKAKAD